MAALEYRGLVLKLNDQELNSQESCRRDTDEYAKDAEFRYPIKRRHREDCKVDGANEHENDRDLSWEQLQTIVSEAKRGGNGEVIAVMLIVQFSLGLRVSEIAPLRWENVFLDFARPSASFVRIVEHAEWTRNSVRPDRIGRGFKNSKSQGGIKELPLIKESFEALKALHHEGAKGLVFPSSAGGLFTYRAIQHRY